jgi:aryl-alcohol dehydrogenase-like predicted oxidoreductase
MTGTRIRGLPVPMSRLVLGGPFGERSDAESFRILDHFLALGGNAVETAHAYADGAAEAQIGRWLRARGCRERVLLITKVCHPRAGEPPSLAGFDEELDASLARIGVEHVDLLLLHRDPVATPVATVLEELERRRAQGALRAFGICNVGSARLAEYGRGAAARGTAGVAAVSNYYGLARQARPPWPGVVQLDDAGERWLREHGVPLLCWSALAQGWFAHRALPEGFGGVYDTPANRARRRRADELASRRGVTGLQVALAYALAAPFELLASVGPRSTDELDGVAAALELRLTGAERAFLQGEDDDRRPAG